MSSNCSEADRMTVYVTTFPVPGNRYSTIFPWRRQSGQKDLGGK
jgi:hypothetical protein